MWSRQTSGSGKRKYNNIGDHVRNCITLLELGRFCALGLVFQRRPDVAWVGSTGENESDEKCRRPCGNKSDNNQYSGIKVLLQTSPEDAPVKEHATDFDHS